ncbi:U6 snRNA phosphodiesterase [Araneus ventricosus]|uniref:U6 snRNA phosphodiesterase n=1 Tax=Araneus ventricosus TaxID=182803 RepID=A0A4Y2RR61_ARAVE|nr:U6 snRNA phosphodiesterase [Araneus ventricosus]GBN78151.1 U6 snRNA phosphodiesterase [Araneus ventricosus]
MLIKAAVAALIVGRLRARTLCTTSRYEVSVAEWTRFTMNEINPTFRLVDYSSDEESSDENEITCQKPVKSNSSLLTDVINSRHETPKSDALPLPLQIQQMYKEMQSEEIVEDPSKHGGKIRSFPHERGIWATYAYIEYNPEPAFYEMIDNLRQTATSHGIELQVPEDFHISLTRTLKLRHHWIVPFIDSLKAKLSYFYHFKIIFQTLEVYENEEKTRTFVGLKVHYGYDQLLKILRKVDACVQEFKLPNFYKNPSFHLSCASCIGSRADEVEKIMADLNIVFQSFIDSQPECGRLWVTKVCCKSGNKLFTLNLKS